MGILFAVILIFYIFADPKINQNTNLMYAIVSIAGQQFKVEKGKKIFVHRLPGAVGAEVSFDKVLLICNKDKVSVGEPYVNNAVVMAQILSHLRGDKIQVFKKKRRKGYQVLKGHRQNLTEILIEDISESGAVKKASPKKEAKKSQEVPKAEKTIAVSKEAAKSKVKKTSVTPKPAVEAAKIRENNIEKSERPVSKPKTVKKTATKKVAETSPTTKSSKAKTTGKKTESKAKPAVKKTTTKKQGTTEKKSADNKKQ